MKILCVGDSLVAGSVGVNWVNLLAQRHKNWKIENAGVNGDTLTRVISHVEAKLAVDPAYDFIVFGAGSNDILIPSFANRGFLFRQAAKHLLCKGYHPIIEIGEFEHALYEGISFIQRHSSAKIVLLTMGCLNEYMPYALNDRRASFNEIIRDLAWDKHCRLADVGNVFEKFFITHTSTNYLLKNFFNTTWLDRYQSMSASAADRLSRERKLHLTIDGVHLNSAGAQIYLEEVEKQILRLI